MAITKSAKKAERASKKKRVFNLRRQSALTAANKSALKAPSAATLAAAYQAIDKAAKSHVITKNTAARKKSRIARALKKVQS